MRIREHPVLADLAERQEIDIYINGEPSRACLGDTVAAALWARGIRRFRVTRRFHEPRGPFCFIGRCTDCEVTVDGNPRVKACITAVREGMRIETPGEET
jgi:predicted molibdopterin-dependent oxidoreductase YjgC